MTVTAEVDDKKMICVHGVWFSREDLVDQVNAERKDKHLDNIGESDLEHIPKGALEKACLSILSKRLGIQERARDRLKELLEEYKEAEASESWTGSAVRQFFDRLRELTK